MEDGTALTIYAVWDKAANLLGEFDTEAEAQEFIDRIRPLGRFGPEGHDLVIVRDEVGE